MNFLLPVCEIRVVSPELLELSLHIIQAGLRIRISRPGGRIDIVEQRAVAVQVLVRSLGRSLALEDGPRIRRRTLGRGS